MASPRMPSRAAIATVGIIGAGTMGSGIAINFLLAGIPTVILETRQEALDRGVKHIQDFFADRVSKRKMKPEKAQALAALLQPTLDYADLANADLVIEAVFEDMGVKQAVFETLDRVCKQGCHPRLQHFNAGPEHDRQLHETAAGRGRRAFLQSGKRHEAARSRARRQDGG